MMSTVPELTQSISSLIEAAGLTIAPIALSTARMLPIVWLAPTFGGRLLPVPARLCLAIGLGLVLAPASTESSPSGFALFAGLLVESLIGISIGLLASLPFELARSSGHLVDVARGAAFAQVIAPGLGDRATPTGDLLYLALLVALTAAGGDRLLVMALADCQAILPVGSMVGPGASLGMSASLIDATTALIVTAVLLAAPPIVVTLLADLVLGVVGRIVPQLPLFFLGMPAKTLLGILMVAFALGPMLGALLDSGSQMPGSLVDLAVWLGGADR